MRTIARIVSVLFHPLLLATYLVAILGYNFPAMLDIAPGSLRIILSFVFCFTFILPVVNIIMFRHFGTISTYQMAERRERFVPFVAIALIYAVMSYLFFAKLPLSENFNRLMALVTALVIFSMLITFFFKMSIHSVAVGGFIGILLPLNKAIENGALLVPTILAIAVAGVVMSARLYLQAHTFTEVWTGTLSGFLIGLIGIFILF